MSNYSTLKQSIRSVIKANGNEEITGTVLQNVLVSIVDTIGVNYTFAGVATPQTNAGSPDQNVFYIGGAGTYTNFGSSYTVPHGSIGVFSYNGSWTRTKVDVIEVIDALDSESTTAALAANQGRVLKSSIDFLEQQTGCYSEKKEINNVGWVHFCEPMKVVQGHSYRVKVKSFGTSGTAAAGVYFYQYPNAPFEARINLFSIPTTDTEGNVTFVSPASVDTAFININAPTWEGFEVTVEDLHMEQLDSEVQSINQSLSDIAFSKSETKARYQGFSHFCEPLILKAGETYHLQVSCSAAGTGVPQVHIYYSMQQHSLLGYVDASGNFSKDFAAQYDSDIAWITIYTESAWNWGIWTVSVSFSAIDNIKASIPINASLSGKEFVILGDSSMTSDKWAGLFAQLCSYAGSTCINAAVGGATWSSAQNPLYQFNQVKSSLQTDSPILLIGCGTGTDNDIISYDNVLQKCYSDVSGETDGIEKAINSLKSILMEYPKACVFLQNNWITSAGGTYNGIQIRNLRRDFYTALCDYFGFALVDIARGGNIHEYTEDYTEDDGATYPKRWATSDGTHVNTDEGKARVLSVWVGKIVSILYKYA